MKIQTQKSHTGSVDAQDKKDRLSNVGVPIDKKNKLDSNTNLTIGASIRILSLNIEGISMAKCEYLTHLLKKHDVDIVLLQETHLDDNQAPSRYNIRGYDVIHQQNHKKYGLLTYARAADQVTDQGGSTETNGTQRNTIKFGDTEITNIYKPPNLKWSAPPKDIVNHPSIILGDFNSHHSDWGYNKNDDSGIETSEWAGQNDLSLIFNPKERGTFKSARWNKDYTPDLLFVTKDTKGKTLPVTREVLEDFPHSQHRPVLIRTGIQIPLNNSLPAPRWNFRKADWKGFAKDIDKTCLRIPPKTENICRFTKLILKSSKKHIPRGFRKQYIPCWSERSKELLKKYEETNEESIADELLESLHENRKERWMELVENLDLTHSSRHAWNTIKKLSPDPNNTKTAPLIEADNIAKEIKQRGQHTPNYRFEKEIRKEYQKTLKSHPEQGLLLSIPVTFNEMEDAIEKVKNGKAAGIDGIYPDMITHLGPKAIAWMAETMTDIMNKGTYPKIWKHAKIIAILKPGKPPTEPSSYRPISLLCCLYKLLERILLERITLYINPCIPIQQAGFRSQRGTTEQVLALTSYIESGFERGEKTGVVLIDLSAAYDTVWTGGLMLKLAKMIPCRKTLKLISTMLGTRQFHVVLGGTKSKIRKIKNGVPQGSVIAPSFFNVYISDMPNCESFNLGYADDWVLAHQSKKWQEIEKVLSIDTSRLKDYFDKWYLKMNTTKSVSASFHLNNREAARELTVTVDNTTLPTDRNPKYLGVILDRQLTYRKHLEGSANKIAKRNCLIRKLANSSWGASQQVLRTSALALCYSAGEYCAPVWMRSPHVKLVDTKLRETMRIVSGCLKSTPTQWLPTMSAIPPPALRRQEANQKIYIQIEETKEQTPLKTIVENAPTTSRLKSRRPFFRSRIEGFDINEEWRNMWRRELPKGGAIILDPTRKMPGFERCNRKEWVTSNRLLTGHGRTAANMHRWNLRESNVCGRCHGAPETTDHIVLQCPATSLPGGFKTIFEADEDFRNWMDNHKMEV